MKKYNKELKEEIIRLHLEEGRSKKSLTQEYEYRAKPENKEEINEAADMLALRKENAELKKDDCTLDKGWGS